MEEDEETDEDEDEDNEWQVDEAESLALKDSENDPIETPDKIRESRIEEYCKLHPPDGTCN